MENEVKSTIEEQVIGFLEKSKSLIIDYRVQQQTFISDFDKNFANLQRLPKDEVMQLYAENPKIQSLVMQINELEKEI